MLQRKHILVLGFMAFALVFACLGASADAAAKFHIGIVTGTVSQSEDDLRGAEKMIQLYGDVANGGMVKHLTYPDNFMSEMETTISQLVSFIIYDLAYFSNSSSRVCYLCKRMTGVVTSLGELSIDGVL